MLDGSSIKGFRNIEDIEYAILENNGTLSVFEYSKNGLVKKSGFVIFNGFN